MDMMTVRKWRQHVALRPAVIRWRDVGQPVPDESVNGNGMF